MGIITKIYLPYDGVFFFIDVSSKINKFLSCGTFLALILSIVVASTDWIWLGNIFFCFFVGEWTGL